MSNLRQIQSRLLEAREKRYSLRKSFATKKHFSISLSLNIPDFPKSNDLINKFFKIVLSEMHVFLQANQVDLILSTSIEHIDDDGNFFIVALKTNSEQKLQSIKKIAEEFEQNHTVGRLIDIDIFDMNAKPISSGKEKSCFFCGQYSAIYCMRNKRHSHSQMQTTISYKIESYIITNRRNSISKKLSQLATKSIIYELALEKKPGLVSFNSTGNHSDMNYITFINSISAISPFFNSFCKLAYNFDGDFSKVLPQIRSIGLECEKEMFIATQNVNTHKGIIFLFGISLFSASLLLDKEQEFSDYNFREIVKNITNNITKNELEIRNKGITHGEKIFTKYGNIGAGARYEAESGFETVFTTALPYFTANLKESISSNIDLFNNVLLKGLLLIMSKNNDSNILYRSDLATLKELQKISNKVNNDEVLHEELMQFCANKNISPGGSADLLALSLFLHFIKTEDL